MLLFFVCFVLVKGSDNLLIWVIRYYFWESDSNLLIVLEVIFEGLIFLILILVKDLYFK